MKHSLQLFLTISLCIATSTSIGMEKEASNPNKNNKENKSNILAEITCIKNPLYAQYLYNGNVVITNGMCVNIIDPKTNREIKPINDCKYQSLAMHPNRKLFALSEFRWIRIYDIEKNDFIWTKKIDRQISSIVFSPHNTTIFLVYPFYPSRSRHTITECNYALNNENNAKEKNLTLEYNTQYPAIAFHPTQNKMYIKHPTSLSCISDITDGTRWDQRGFDTGRKLCKLCQYSPDGSLLALGNPQTVITVNIDSYASSQDKIDFHTFQEPNLIESISENSYACEKIQFYSNSVLITLCRDKNGFSSTLYYWDIHTKELIHKESFGNRSTIYDFSFSPNKLEIIFTLLDKCIVLPVPFKAIYEDIAEKTLLYDLFALKQYIHAGTTIPNELTQFIIKTALETYKRY